MSRVDSKPFFERREKILVVVGLIGLLVILSSLILLLARLIVVRENTLMQFEAERGFSSSTLLLLQEEHSRALSAMAEDNIKGIGVYTSNGRLRLGLGSVPNTLPLDRFYELYSKQRGKPTPTQGIATYNKTTQMIEYVRFSRLTIQLETGALMLEGDGFLPSPLTFSDVVYVLFDGQSYYYKTILVRIVTIAAILAAVAFTFILYKIYLRNRLYRETIEKQESLVSLGEAARTLAHEIKNPLSALTLQMALLKKTLPATSKEDLGVMDQELERLNQLTNKISDFLRNPIGNPEKLDLYTLLDSIKGTFQEQIKITKGTNQRVYIYFDYDRARSVFENLIKNGLESYTKGRAFVEIEVTKDKRQMIHIYIKDRGEGLDPSQVSKLFDPFFTTKIYGSGIGLSICSQFVRARGGKIKLYNREGGGAISEVILPSKPTN
jgi:two-component system sensor histidine kinase HydH